MTVRWRPAGPPGNGGAIFKNQFSIGDYGFIALVKDTEGNLIGLHSMRSAIPAARGLRAKE